MLTGFAISVNDSPSIFAQAQAQGAQTLRVDVPWAQVELVKGQRKIPAACNAQLNEMLRLGLAPLVILDYSNTLYMPGKPMTAADFTAFGNYAVFVVTKLYARGIARFEVWNEWETQCGGAPAGTADQYMALANAVVPRLRAAAPGATIISAGMSDPATKTPYFARMLALGAADLFDGLGIHPYCGCSTDTPAGRIAQLDALQAQAAAAAGRPVDFYLTEWGWSTYQPCPMGVDQATQAANVASWLPLCAARPWIKGAWQYTLRDQGTDPTNKEHNFGVNDINMQPKLAAASFKAAA